MVMSSMAKQTPERANLLQGTLDMLILRTLLYGPAHGHQIGKHISGLRMNFYICSMARCTPPCTGWRKGMGCRQMGDRSGSQSGIQVLPFDGKRQETACSRRIRVEADRRSCGASDVARG